MHGTNIINTSNTSDNSSNSNKKSNNCIIRIQQVSIIFILLALSGYMGGCKADLTGCTISSILINKTAFSILIYNSLSSIFQFIFKKISCQLNLILSSWVSVIFFIYSPDYLFQYVTPLMRYLAVLWFGFQGLIVIDIAHDIHRYIITKAQDACSLRGEYLKVFIICLCIQKLLIYSLTYPLIYLHS